MNEVQVNVVDHINELSELSRKLNQKSDTLNEIIVSINTKLQKLNFGIEVWLDSKWVDEGAPYYGGDDGDLGPFLETTVLGYAPVNDTWQLAVKTVTMVTADSGVLPWKVDSAEPARALLQATRIHRMQSMPLIPDLLDELKRAAQKLLRNIEAAEKRAKEL